MERFAFQALGSQIFIELPKNADPKVYEAIEQEAHRIEQKYSRFMADSLLVHLNKNIDEWQAVDDETLHILEAALMVHKATNKAFNPCVKQILEAWGYDADYTLLPTDESTRISSPECFELDTENKKLRLFSSLDLGGLGKGYFVDQAKKICESHGLDTYLINAGGDMYGSGTVGEVFFEHPTDPKQIIGSLEINNLFIASSSPLRRSWKDWHHLVDPIEVAPARSNLSVYLQSRESGILTDAFSTALFVMGFEAAKELLKKETLPIEAMLISPDYAIYRSAGFVGDLFKS